MIHSVFIPEIFAFKGSMDSHDISLWHHRNGGMLLLLIVVVVVVVVAILLVMITTGHQQGRNQVTLVAHNQNGNVSIEFLGVGDCHESFAPQGIPGA